MLFADQSPEEFSAADWQQEIDLSIDGCRFALRNEQRLPHHSLQAGKNAREELDRPDNREKNDSDRLQAPADMSQRVWHDALAGPDGEFLRGNHQIKEAADRKLDARRTFMPFLGFGLHLKPDAVADVIAALDLYKESYCSP